MSKGDPVVIGGAGSSIADFLEEAGALGHTIRAEGREGGGASYVGLDLPIGSHRSSCRKLLANWNQLGEDRRTGAGQCRSDANKRSSLRFCYGFGAWVVNRALQTLPPEDMPFAKKYRLTICPEEAMKELVAAKTGLYGKICSIQTKWAANDSVRCFRSHPISIENRHFC